MRYLIKLSSLHLCARLLGMATSFYLVNILGPQDYGQLQIIRTTFGLLLIIIDWGFNYHISVLLNQRNVEKNSVSRLLYSTRSTLLFMGMPILVAINYSLGVDSTLLVVIIVFGLVAIFDYEPFSVALGHPIAGAFAMLAKSITIATIVFMFNASSVHEALLAFLGGAAASATIQWLLLRPTPWKKQCATDLVIVDELKSAFPFFSIVLSMSLLQMMVLPLASVFIEPNEIGHLAVALTLTEFGMFLSYQVRRMVQAKYFEDPDSGYLLKVGALLEIFLATGFILFIFLGTFILEFAFVEYDVDLLYRLLLFCGAIVLTRSPTCLLTLHLSALGGKVHLAKIYTYSAIACTITSMALLITFKTPESALIGVVISDLLVLSLVTLQSRRLNRIDRPG